MVGANMNDEGIVYYDEKPFVVIKEGQEQIIKLLCDSIFAYHLSDNTEQEEQVENIEEQAQLTDDNEAYASGREFLKNFLLKLPKPITVIQEGYHIDRSYRDTYYMYFSNQHFQVKRYSRRLSFFFGEINDEVFFGEDSQERLQKAFIGACVINPLVAGSIGRTLISPKYSISMPDGEKAYVRLSTFDINVYGRKFQVRAFPYRMQDEETMCCAEVTILNLLEYYANQYNDYKTVVPSEIITQEQKHSHERVLPARGITYPVLTKVLSEFGFSPRLYNVSAIDSYKYSSLSKEDELRRWLHYYIESGIPVAVNLVPIGISGTGHSMVCIGHGPAKEELKEIATKRKWITWSERSNAHPLINSADFYDQYVVVDDNEPIYHLRKFKALSLYPDMRIENLAVPLYKRMFLDAPNAYSTIRSLLQSKAFGISEWADSFLKPKEDVIIRMFMASSKSFKAFRMKTLKGVDLRKLYMLIPMPRFVWVCELYRVEDYNTLQAFGEIVIDATSAPNRGHRSLILMHYPSSIAYRMPGQADVGFEVMAEIEKPELFSGFISNLEET